MPRCVRLAVPNTARFCRRDAEYVAMAVRVKEKLFVRSVLSFTEPGGDVSD